MRISGAVDSGRRELYPEKFDPNRLISLEDAPAPRN